MRSFFYVIQRLDFPALWSWTRSTRRV